MEHDGDRRRELERAAYGENTTDDERQAALVELARLDADRARPGTTLEPATDDPPASASTGSVPTEPEQEAGRRPRRERRLIAIGVVVAAVIVGGVGGFLGGSLPQTSTGTSPEATPTGDPAATSRLAAGDPASGATAVSPAQAAEAFLGRKATPADAYPGLNAPDDLFITASTRLVAMTASGERVWAAKSSSSTGGFCLVTLRAQPDSNGFDGLSTCATPTEFSATGVTVTSDDYTATWKGGTVTVDVTSNG